MSLIRNWSLRKIYSVSSNSISMTLSSNAISAAAINLKILSLRKSSCALYVSYPMWFFCPLGKVVKRLSLYLFTRPTKQKLFCYLFWLLYYNDYYYSFHKGLIFSWNNMKVKENILTASFQFSNKNDNLQTD